MSDNSRLILVLLPSDCIDLKAVIQSGLEWAKATRNIEERLRYERIYKNIYLQILSQRIHLIE